jgi:TRAP-type C4-dicarboxylate transport system permease small subunit
MKVLSVVGNILRKINTVLVAVCGGAFFLYMFNVVGDITGRYLFLKPITGTIEIGQLVLAFATFMSLAFVQMQGTHIRLPVLTERLSPLWQALLELLTLAVGIALVGLMAWQGYRIAINSWKIMEYANTAPVPIYIGKSAVFIGCSLFTLQLVFDFIKQIVSILTPRNSLNGGDNR